MAGLLDKCADFRAITMVVGNVGFEQQIKNAHMISNSAGKLGEVMETQTTPNRPFQKAD